MPQDVNLHSPKPRRFFYHYRKQDKKMSVHFQGQCIPCDNVVCYERSDTKWNKRQPYLVMEGYTTNVCIEDDGDGSGVTVYIGTH